MGRYLNVGNDGFRAIRKGRYVDKTGLISFINETLGTADKLTCVSRARRFGKSFAVKMLCAYYDKSCDSSELFDGLEIAEDPSYRKYLNKYDVIYLDMTLFISLCGNMKDIMAYIQEQVIQEMPMYTLRRRGRSIWPWQWRKPVRRRALNSLSS